MEHFKIDIAPSVIADLKNRLSQQRWPGHIENSGWDYGTDENYLKELCDYWQNGFDWQKQQDHLNTFAQFKTEVDGFGIHFIYEKGKGQKPIPLLLTHGFPDSFVRFLKLVPLLVEEDENGLCFDVIVPSIPGYGFSDIPAAAGMNPAKVSALFGGLMKQLGYRKYIAQGGDWGSTITEQLAWQFPENLYGIHLTDIPFYHLFNIPSGELTKAEKKYLATGKQWSATEGAYAMLQSTKPQTLGIGLNDSPAGLASWIIEKFERWSDNHGNLENSFTKDELLTNLTIYWATQTINSAMRIYYESAKLPPPRQTSKLKTSVAAAMFPKDLVPAPKEFADRMYNIIQWTEMPKGGHFAAMEEPALLAMDIRNFAKKLEYLIVLES